MTDQLSPKGNRCLHYPDGCLRAADGSECFPCDHSATRLPERLRNYALTEEPNWEAQDLLDAADEIERLQQQVATLERSNRRLREKLDKVHS
jgi:hypothetical protein